MILHKRRQIATGCLEADIEGAREKLRSYCDPKQYWRYHRKKRQSRTGLIYFIEADGLDAIKIGFTTDIGKRLADLKTALPVQLRLIGSVVGPASLEQSIHKSLKEHRITGEWFRRQPALDEMSKHNVDVSLIISLARRKRKMLSA